MGRTRAAAVALITALAVAACASCGGAAPGTSGGTDLATTSADLVGVWHPETIRGFTFHDEAQRRAAALTLRADGSWRSSDGCNDVGGTYTVSAGDRVAFTTGSSTMIGCFNVPYASSLGEVRGVQVDRRLLVLSDASGSAVARFTR